MGQGWHARKDGGRASEEAGTGMKIILNAASPHGAGNRVFCGFRFAP